MFSIASRNFLAAFKGNTLNRAFLKSNLTFTHPASSFYRLLSTETKGKIEQAIQKDSICLFMKGTPSFPQCGFSRAVVAILQMQGIEAFHHVNVLEEDDIRSGIKEFSSWPTIPQLYIKGEFIGGCDILMTMHQNGDLEKLLLEKKLVEPVEESPSS
ncbi:monothiol glutaredoxin grx5 [Entomophthora muscae]|uniref:Monothiol glutaredoxin grx5 n=1 Tax=Entomophthora muscae TaxID=34485 RepID=A0ACC2T5R1_9FUNG|nr:monothiol glutaredoxin grx5 [Entomophthora muscae]